MGSAHSENDKSGKATHEPKLAPKHTKAGNDGGTCSAITHAGEDFVGLLKVTVASAHMRRRGYYNVTTSIGMQVRAVWLCTTHMSASASALRIDNLPHRHSKQSRATMPGHVSNALAEARVIVPWPH
jgi:3,4-dihydroxy-2-butanone 4-phosphate synthase